MSRPVDANFDDGLVLSGYQKKLNTMKKKFFVLYKDTNRESARLEYFDSIKKFKSGAVPKRVVKLENCFNINRRLDTKHDYVIALATKDGGFGIVLDSEAEMLKWLQALLFLQRSITNKSEIYMPKFEHVWQVIVQKKALAEERKIIGNYHVCLSAKSVTFIRIGPERSSSGYIRATDIYIPLNTIRRCGDSHCLFYMEVGRQCIIGPGELWMETEDPLVAQSMHKMISSAMSAKTESIGDSMRKRSSSVTEASKPNSFTDTGNFRGDNKNYNMNQSGNSNMTRGRCDSFPTRIQESSDILKQSFKSSQIQNIPCSIVPGSFVLSRHSTSPPSVSPFVCAEMKETLKLEEQEESGNYLPYRFKSAERAIPEENSDDLINSDSNISFQGETYISMAPLSIDNNKTQKERHIGSGDAASLSSANSQNSMVTTLLSSQMHSIIISSAMPNESENDERPKRSYSIGSRVDKNKNKRLENSNEIVHDTNAIRVRAFSVGSRAKIPKCDLQRAVLYPRSRYNTSCISNNSLNFGADELGYKLELNANSEKKSTSAPLLVQNSQLPVDCMSDLMEIDFSKSSSHKTHGKLVPANEKSSEICVNEIKGSHISKSDCDFSQPLPPLPTTEEQSGYLEMKPVNHESFHTINKSSPALCKKNSDKMANLNNIFTEASLTKKEFEKSFQEKCTNVAKVTKNQKNRFSLATKRLNPVLLEENGINRTEMNASTGTAKNSLQNTNDFIKETSLSTGREQKLALPVISETISASSSTPSSLYQPISSTLKSSSVSQCKDKQMQQNVVSCGESEGYCIIDNKTQQSNTPTCSTASSCYELYYAKLDLPKYSTKDIPKFHKGEADISTRINAENDSYAKIDFDHSSDSSSSSKTLIN